MGGLSISGGFSNLGSPERNLFSRQAASIFHFHAGNASSANRLIINNLSFAFVNATDVDWQVLQGSASVEPTETIHWNQSW